MGSMVIVATFLALHSESRFVGGFGCFMVGVWGVRGVGVEGWLWVCGG